MASIPAPSPLKNAQVNAVLLRGAGVICHNQRSAAKDVIMERDRAKQIKRLREAGGSDWVTDEEMVDAFFRKQKVLLKFADDVAPEWARTIFMQISNIGTDMNDRMNRMYDKIDGIEAMIDAKIDARIGEMEARLDVKMEGMEARIDAKMEGRFEKIETKIDEMGAVMDAGNARAHNASISRFDNLKIRPVVKYINGHPEPIHIEMSEFNFNEQEYMIGMAPPDNLVPETFQGIRSINSYLRFTAIHWFYNDSRLTVGNKNLIDLRAALEEFVKYF